MHVLCANTRVNAQHILGAAGTYVVLSFRRPGGMSDQDYYFDVQLEREKAPPMGAPDVSTYGVQRAHPQQMQRAGPPPQSSGYENEIANLRQQVDMLRSMQGMEDDARVAPLENELQERINDLQRVETMYERARDRLEVSQRNCHEVSSVSTLPFTLLLPPAPRNRRCGLVYVYDVFVAIDVAGKYTSRSAARRKCSADGAGQGARWKVRGSTPREWYAHT
jgi:hypothetical protein